MIHPTRVSHSLPTVQLGDKGRLVLPANVRKALGLQPGDRLVVTLEEPGVVRLTSAREIARRGRGMLGSKTPGQDLAGELIAERRKDAVFTADRSWHEVALPDLEVRLFR